MQRTLKRESKVLEIVAREAIEAFREEVPGLTARGALPLVPAPRGDVRPFAHGGVGGRPSDPSGGRRSVPRPEQSVGEGAPVARAGQRRSGGREEAPGRVAWLASRRRARTARGGSPSPSPTEEEP